MIVPTRVWPMVKSPSAGMGHQARAWAWSCSAGPKSNPDRSVADFVIDHFGQETLDYLAEPLLSGVYGGDPREMSVVSVLGRFAEMETKSGSLAPRGVEAVPRAEVARRRKRPLFRTLKGGLGTLTAKLAEGLAVRRGEVETIERSGNWVPRSREWRVDGCIERDSGVSGMGRGGAGSAARRAARRAAQRDSVHFFGHRRACVTTPARSMAGAPVMDS